MTDTIHMKMFLQNATVLVTDLFTFTQKCSMPFLLDVSALINKTLIF